MGVPSTRRVQGAGFLAALVLAGMPGRVAADAGGSVVLTEQAIASMAADLDGDGQGEVLIIRRNLDGDDRVLVEAWGMDGGEWRPVGSAAIERWDDDAGERGPAAFGREGFGLLSLRDAGRTRSFVATASARPTASGPSSGPCCLGLSELRADSGGITLDLIERTFGPAESLQAADLDGDGTDEVLITASLPASADESAIMQYALLRQTGRGFESEGLPLEPSQSLWLTIVGNTDGVAGDDLHFTDDAGQDVMRVVDQDGALLVESVPLTSFGNRLSGGWPAGAAGGLLGWAEENALRSFRWPRTATPRLVGELTTADFPAMYVIGAGEHARWLEYGGAGGGPSPDEAWIRVYDEALDLVETVDVPDLSRRLWELNGRGPFSATAPDRSLWENIAPVPGLGPDRAAILGYGSLLELDAAGRLRVTPASHLVGVGVSGVAGEDDGWIVVSAEWWGSGTLAFLGNVGYEPAYGMVGVISMRRLLDVEANVEPMVAFDGARMITTEAGPRLFTSGDPFQLTVHGEPGDVVVAYDERATVSRSIPGDSVSLAIDPPGRAERNREFELTVLVLGPTGIVTAASWRAESLRLAPEVTFDVGLEAFALKATISGTVSEHATLTVDGRPVEPASSGEFSVEVDAPFWPRDIVITARDPVGNETTQSLEIIGFLDYRGLPWIPIAGTLTVMAGLILFVRTPRPRPEARLRSDGDGRLEEIDGDLI